MREERAFSTELLGWGVGEGGRRGQRAGEGTLQKRRGRWRNKKGGSWRRESVRRDEKTANEVYEYTRRAID